jgi:hypothetical protein
MINMRQEQRCRQLTTILNHWPITVNAKDKSHIVYCKSKTNSTLMYVE